MIKKLKNFICKLFNIKACQCDDEQVEVQVKEIIHPCPIHRYFKAKCHMCVAHANGINL